jgi:hypothetical protein
MGGTWQEVGRQGGMVVRARRAAVDVGAGGRSRRCWKATPVTRARAADWRVLVHLVCMLASEKGKAGRLGAGRLLPLHTLRRRNLGRCSMKG